MIGVPQRAHFTARKAGQVALQVVLVAVVCGLAYAAFINAADNLARAHIASGFRFWDNTAGFDISQTLIAYSVSTSTFGRAFWVGLLNTLLVAGVGIVLATVLGFAIAIARLSRNWLVARLAGGYVELIRNIPLLLQLLFWYNAVLKALPELRESIALPGGGFLNNRGLFLPRPDFEPGFGAVLIALSIAVAAAFRCMSGRVAARSAPARGRTSSAGCWLLIFGLPLAVFALAGLPLSFSFPQMGRFNVVGGIEILPEFAALLLALSVYTAAFIAEVVRAGILVRCAWADRGGAVARAPVRHDAAADCDSPGDAGHRAAAHQPIFEFDEKLLARRRYWLSRSGSGLCRLGAQHHRPSRRGHRHHHGGLSRHQPSHLATHESLWPHDRDRGALTNMAATSEFPNGYVRKVPAERLAPPPTRAGFVGWLRANLFSSPTNIAFTLACALLIVWAVPPLLRFLLIDAIWSGADREACLASPANPDPGACWAFVRVWYSYFIYGFYPIAERWRVDVFFAALAFGIAWLLWPSAPRRVMSAVYFLIVLPVLSVVLLYGFPLIGLVAVPTIVVGRHAGDGRRGHYRHRGFAADRHLPGAGAPLQPPGSAAIVGHLHRVRPRRAVDHRAVHGKRHAAIICPRALGARQTRARSHRCGHVRVSLHGRGDPQRDGGDPARTIRGGARSGLDLLAHDGAGHPAASAAGDAAEHRQYVYRAL